MLVILDPLKPNGENNNLLPTGGVCFQMVNKCLYLWLRCCYVQESGMCVCVCVCVCVFWIHMSVVCSQDNALTGCVCCEDGGSWVPGPGRDRLLWRLCGQFRVFMNIWYNNSVWGRFRLHPQHYAREQLNRNFLKLWCRRSLPDWFSSVTWLGYQRWIHSNTSCQ